MGECWLARGNSFMTGLASIPGASALRGRFLKSRMYAFIAEHLGVDVKLISDETHIGDDFGLDYIDIVELTVLLEEKFAPGRVLNDTDEIECVGDLIRHIEMSDDASHSRE